MSESYEIREGTDLKWGIYSTEYNIRIAEFYPNTETDRKQIKKMIQSHPNLDQSLAQGQGKVTEEWIEEKARKAWNLWWYKASGKYGADFTGTIRFDFQGVKNLIRSLVEEISSQ